MLLQRQVRTSVSIPLYLDPGSSGCKRRVHLCQCWLPRFSWWCKCLQHFFVGEECGQPEMAWLGWEGYMRKDGVPFSRWRLCVCTFQQDDEVLPRQQAPSTTPGDVQLSNNSNEASGSAGIWSTESSKFWRKITSATHLLREMSHWFVVRFTTCASDGSALLKVVWSAPSALPSFTQALMRWSTTRLISLECSWERSLHSISTGASKIAHFEHVVMYSKDKYVFCKGK